MAGWAEPRRARGRATPAPIERGPSPSRLRRARVASRVGRAFPAAPAPPRRRPRSEALRFTRDATERGFGEKVPGKNANLRFAPRAWRRARFPPSSSRGRRWVRRREGWRRARRREELSARGDELMMRTPFESARARRFRFRRFVRVVRVCPLSSRASGIESRLGKNSSSMLTPEKFRISRFLPTPA